MQSLFAIIYQQHALRNEITNDIFTATLDEKVMVIITRVADDNYAIKFIRVAPVVDVDVNLKSLRR